MSNYRFIGKNLDVSEILKQLNDNPDDWNIVSKMQNTGGDQNPYGFLPLVMAKVAFATDDPKNTEMQQQTPMYKKYTSIRKFLKNYGIREISRAAFFRLKVGHGVERHIDVGDYYLTRDRFHIALSGTYLYEVDGEEHVIEPGTFFWFDNKKYHSALNIGDVDRVSFVFDVPHRIPHPNNSRNFLKEYP